jgi:tetrahydromethanopterin S-methyltransferase subunit G
VTGGEYAGKMLCYDCTTKLVKDNVEELQKNHNYIHGQYTQCLVGCAIGGVIGFIWGLSGGIMGALLYMVLCAAIGGSASNFFHRFIAAIPGFFVSTGNMVISICVGLFKFIFCFFLYAIMALFETVKKILYYRNYMAQTADCLEKDSSALQCIRDRMEYSRVMNENRGMSLADLMNEGSELYNNSYARMVQEQGEEKAEAFVSSCTTQIAENGEIIRSFAA